MRFRSRELIFEVGGWSFGVRERVCYIFGGRWWRLFSDVTATDSLKAMGGGMGGGIANDMYNNDVGKGVVYAYEAYEAK